VLQCGPRTGKTWFHVGLILPNESPVDGDVRELSKEIGLTLIVDDLTLLSGNNVRVPSPDGQHQIVHVFSASVPVPCMTANLRTRAKVEQLV
jgi:ADP-ribose pyrophosphatase YjhB (NUDIX family)